MNNNDRYFELKRYVDEHIDINKVCFYVDEYCKKVESELLKQLAKKEYTTLELRATYQAAIAFKENIYTIMKERDIKLRQLQQLQERGLNNEE